MMDPTDRAWFRRHPHRRYRIRPLTALEMLNCDMSTVGQLVRVIRNAPPQAAFTAAIIGQAGDTDAQAAELMLDACAMHGGMVRH